MIQKNKVQVRYFILFKSSWLIFPIKSSSEQLFQVQALKEKCQNWARTAGPDLAGISSCKFYLLLPTSQKYLHSLA